ncbi:MAG: cation-transporting P-type ATPase [Magnetospirillum sp. WYHS-4]
MEGSVRVASSGRRRAAKRARSAVLPTGVAPIHLEVAGRVRIRVAGLRRNEVLARRLERDLATAAGIRSVSASTWSGNILIRFDGEGHLPDILAAVARLRAGFLVEGGAVQVDQPRAPHKPAAKVQAAVQRLPLAAAGAPEAPDGLPWHLGETGRVAGLLGSDAGTGLIPAEATERLGRYGLNALPEAEPPSKLAMLMGQVTTLPVGLLVLSAVISAATGGIVDGMVILTVIGINAAIGYVTESNAEKTIRSLGSRIRPTALVRRAGKEIEIKVQEIVPGDLLVLGPGIFIAADARVVGAVNLTVDESMLTGESLPVGKTTAPLLDADTPLADRHNMVYKGTLVTGGSGLALVVATGLETEIGAIQRLVGEAKAPDTPMQRQLDDMGRQLALLSGAICGVVFVAGLARGFGFVEMLKGAVALAVAAVPEGLPTVATTTLALGIRDMRRHGVLIRQLPAVETLGSVQVMCFDKTGTLTENRMSVTALRTAIGSYRLLEGLFTEDGNIVAPKTHRDLRQLLEVVVLCSETKISVADGKLALDGSPTEAALVRAAIQADLDPVRLRGEYPLLETRTRAEGRPWMATVHAMADGRRMVGVKGNPAAVLELCGWFLGADGLAPLTPEAREGFLEANDDMADDGLRVLGVALGHHEGEGEAAEHGLIWLGLAGMADPLRGGMRELMGTFHRAGIHTVMITGDQSATAYAIAKELDLNQGRPIDILDAGQLDRLDPELLASLAQRAHVFARVSPAHKLRIVQALQRAGKVIAMTGDGINDGPALKAADIGVAMGKGGSDVAHELADVVLEDDQLQTMAVAVGQGRTIYANTRKALHFLLATNLSEIALVTAGTVIGLGHPLSPMQLLWINLVSDIFPGLALSLEAPEPDVLRHPPRDPSEPIVRRRDLGRTAAEGAIMSAGALAAYGYGLARYGAGPQASTMAFLGLSTAQLLHTFSCRSDRRLFDGGPPLPPNPALKWAMAGSFGAQALAAAFPPLRGLLGLAPLRPVDWLVTAGAAALPFIANELLKPAFAERREEAEDPGNEEEKP